MKRPKYKSISPHFGRCAVARASRDVCSPDPVNPTRGELAIRATPTAPPVASLAALLALAVRPGACGQGAIC